MRLNPLISLCGCWPPYASSQGKFLLCELCTWEQPPVDMKIFRTADINRYCAVSNGLPAACLVVLIKWNPGECNTVSKWVLYLLCLAGMWHTWWSVSSVDLSEESPSSCRRTSERGGTTSPQRSVSTFNVFSLCKCKKGREAADHSVLCLAAGFCSGEGHPRGGS